MNTTTAPASELGLDSTELVSLTDAAHHVTGRPSTSALWRWCRRGVLARDGSRIRLEHRRVGGKIFTSPTWLDAFMKALTDADSVYFAAKQTAADGALPRAPAFDAPKRPRRPRRPKPSVTSDHQRRVRDDLDQEGI